MSAPLLVQREGPVATLVLNRPESLNTLDFALMDALVAATAEVAADDALRVVVIRGAGKHFMAGGDLRTFAGELAKPAVATQRRLPRAHRPRCIARSKRCIGCRIRWSRACTARSPVSVCR